MPRFSELMQVYPIDRDRHSSEMRWNLAAARESIVKRGTWSCRPVPVRLPAAATLPSRRLEVNLERVAVEILTVQTSYGAACLVALHLDEAKASALTRKDVDHQIYGTHLAKLGEQHFETFFRGSGRQIADKQFLQCLSSSRVGARAW